MPVGGRYKNTKYGHNASGDDEIIHEMKRHGWDCFKENTE